MIFTIEAVIGCLLFTALCVPSVVKNPLKWVDDYPPAIIARCRELKLIPDTRQRISSAAVARKIIGSLLIAAALALVLYLFNQVRNFLGGFVVAYGLWLVVCWYDALVLDCLWFCHSKKAIIPGTEDLTKAYHDYLFHIKMSGIGTLLGLPVSLLAGGLVSLLSVLF